MRAVQITEFGGPEVLRLVELPDPVATDGFEVVEVSSAGVNYADTHHLRDHRELWGHGPAPRTPWPAARPCAINSSTSPSD